ncbi:MAG: hypothetical protein ABI551_14120 [Polyangiaceae bacterium]
MKIAPLVLVLVSIASCGGIEEPDLLAPGGPSTGSGGADAGSGAKDGGSDKDASVSVDAGDKTTDAGVVVAVDSGGPTTGSGDGIYCGGSGASALYCKGADICCVKNNQGATGQRQYACTTESDCNDANDTFGDLVISCDSPVDCKGKAVCCGTFVTASSPYYDEVTCNTDCTSQDNRIFCDPARGNDDCPSPQTCQPSGALPGFHVCGS